MNNYCRDDDVAENEYEPHGDEGRRRDCIDGGGGVSVRPTRHASSGNAALRECWPLDYDIWCRSAEVRMITSGWMLFRS